MFPPSKTDSLTETVQNLWESLNRAGGHFHTEANIVERSEGDLITLWLTNALPKGSKRLMSAYIKEYIRESGWKAVHIRYYKNRIEFLMTPDLHPTSRETS